MCAELRGSLDELVAIAFACQGFEYLRYVGGAAGFEGDVDDGFAEA